MSGGPPVEGAGGGGAIECEEIIESCSSHTGDERVAGGVDLEVKICLQCLVHKKQHLKVVKEVLHILLLIIHLMLRR